MSSPIAAVTDFVAIDADTIDLIREKHGGDDTKVINLIKSIEKRAEEESGDPFLIAMADRARQIQESYEDRQTSTQEALDELFADIKRNEQRKKEQAEKGYDSLRYFVFAALEQARVKDADDVSAKVARAFVEQPTWRQSEAALRELRKAVTSSCRPSPSRTSCSMVSLRRRRCASCLLPSAFQKLVWAS